MRGVQCVREHGQMRDCDLAAIIKVVVAGM